MLVLGDQLDLDAAAFDGFDAARAVFEPDAITREVIALVEARFATHPGRLDDFAWPVTRAQALVALQRFIGERLPLFGRHQDAMWPGEPWLYHAHLGAALNLKLLRARGVVDAAVAAYRAGAAPLASVEGFVRQILGWREYVRCIYWTRMPAYAELNALDAHENLPGWYWTGDTDMACLRDAIGQTLRHGYAHHIQRLMVTGLFALMFGVQPQQVHAWYLAVYVDAVEWVELPNTLGMSQYADGGLMASKPSVATGKYIQRMSPHCQGCRDHPAQRTGDRACPFTTLYWDFLMHHQATLAGNPRMALQVKNVAHAAVARRGERHRSSGQGRVRRTSPRQTHRAASEPDAQRRVGGPCAKAACAVARRLGGREHRSGQACAQLLAHRHEPGCVGLVGQHGASPQRPHRGPGALLRLHAAWQARTGPADRVETTLERHTVEPDATRVQAQAPLVQQHRVGTAQQAAQACERDFERLVAPFTGLARPQRGGDQVGCHPLVAAFDRHAAQQRQRLARGLATA